METPLIGDSESIKRIRKLIKYVADTDLNVIITGESGVGKEVVALHLAHESQRKDKPFIKVDCASLPGGLLESELFGFERGSLLPMPIEKSVENSNWLIKGLYT